MDDVLASIRRIVRSEKEPDEAVEQPSQADAAVSSTEAAPVPEPQPDAVQTFDEAPEDEIDAPLALTPDMRMDASAEPTSEGAPMSDETTTMAAAPAPAIEPVSADGDGKLRGMIREVLLEELSGDQAGELVRQVIRDELVNGEIGGNISQNVMALIQSEVAKAMGR